MIKNKASSIFFLLSSLMPISSYAAASLTELAQVPLVLPSINLSHFNHLYTEIQVQQSPLEVKTLGIVHIYSEAPDYRFAIEPAEGYTCVDDVARAMVMLTEYLRLPESDTSSEQHIEQIKKMTEFVLYMQNENGYFNNFIWHDHSINTEYRTTVAEMNWWTFRAIWGLSSALPYLEGNRALVARVNQAINNAVDNIKVDLAPKKEAFNVFEGVLVPNWLPNDYAADQAALAIISLLPLYQANHDEEVLAILHAQARGLMAMQKGDADNYPYGMFLSWKNQWHSWGNNQAYALLLAGQALNKQEYIDSALIEINHFYPHLLSSGFAEGIWIEKVQGEYHQSAKNAFPQIAYGIRPMVYATAKAYEITQDKKYLRLAHKITGWLFGDNDTKVAMYHPENGRIYDALISVDKVNQNSGAESTIEGLMVLIKNKQLQEK